MKHLLSINEDGESGGMAVAGMGDIVSSQPSVYSGDVSGSTIGSGDIGMHLGNKAKSMPMEIGKNHGPRTGKKTREKRVDVKAIKSALRDRKNAKPSGKIMSFDSFAKKDTSKVVQVNDLSKLSEGISSNDNGLWAGTRVLVTKADQTLCEGIVIKARPSKNDDRLGSEILMTITDANGKKQFGFFKEEL